AKGAKRAPAILNFLVISVPWWFIHSFFSLKTSPWRAAVPGAIRRQQRLPAVSQVPRAGERRRCLRLAAAAELRGEALGVEPVLAAVVLIAEPVAPIGGIARR